MNHRRISPLVFAAAFVACGGLSERIASFAQTSQTLPTVSPKTVTEPVTAGETVTAIDAVESPTIDLTSLTKDELIAVATERNVKVAKSWTKAKILAALATV